VEHETKIGLSLGWFFGYLPVSQPS